MASLNNYQGHVVLPDTNRVALVKQLLAKKPELKVLLSSGYIGDKFLMSVIDKKGFSFLKKPYTTNKLIETINRILLN